MIPPFLASFLHDNPYPSLSFLPMQDGIKKEEIVFFYQNSQEELSLLQGNINTKFTFYEEPQAYIMRFEFFPYQVTNIEFEGVSHTRINLDFPMVETEFAKSPSNIDALIKLSMQSEFRLFLYDKKTQFFKQKLFEFTFGKEALTIFLKSKKIIP